MIIETLVNYFVSLLSGALDAFNILSLPVDLISTLSTIASYGSYVVGADLLLVFCSCVGGWLTFKLTVGIVLFIWDLLPFT